jgi:hypothetical protein
MFSKKNRNALFSANCPETCIIFVTYGREEIAKRSFSSLTNAMSNYRDRVKLIVSDATNDLSKISWFKDAGADDIIWTPHFTSAATSRNLAVALMLDKYSAENICLLEDDFEYSEHWYPVLLKTCRENFGKISPWGLSYGMFTASTHKIENERIKNDSSNGLRAYIFGGVADQRFMPTHHYLSTLRMWDPDILGVSYCQTGMQTSRNTMRGFCGGIISATDNWLCRPIPGQESTWSGGKRDVGPVAHELNLDKFRIICETAKKIGVYEKN